MGDVVDVVAFTGHRPERLRGLGGDRTDQVRKAIDEYLDQLKPSMVISGMAQGVDMIAFHSARLRDIPVIAAVPWKGHAGQWSASKRNEYLALLEQAEDVVITSPVEDYELSVYSVRNRWMVDKCTVLAAVWDGSDDGGTYDAIRYARRISRPINYLQWRYNG